MQLGRQDAADKFYLPTAEIRSYTPKRSGKELGVLFAKEGGVSVMSLAFLNFVPQVFNAFLFQKCSQHAEAVVTNVLLNTS